MNRLTALGLFIILGLLLASKHAFALRCGNELINEGDSLYEAEKVCQFEGEYRVQNENADIVKKYNKQGGMTNEMIFIDGKLTEINSYR